MATATEVGFTADHVLDVLKRESQPLTTLEVTLGVAKSLGVAPEAIQVTRLRRALERLVERGDAVASGGPKRDHLLGWPIGDGRDVQWATADVAEGIAENYERSQALVEAARQERAVLLRELSKRCLYRWQRDALGLVNIAGHLREDIDYRGEHGASTWDLDELRTIASLLGLAE